jgi:hypothetical protein
MKAREKLTWCLTGLLALAAAAGWGFYYGECQARAEEREQWRANIRLLETHAMHGMMQDAQRAKEQALPPDPSGSQ